MTCWSATASPSWDADAQAARLQLVAQPVGVVAPVAQDALGGWQLGQEHQGSSGVAHLAWREKEGQRPASAVADHVQLGVQPTLGASDRPRPRPPFERLAAVR